MSETHLKNPNENDVFGCFDEDGDVGDGVNIDDASHKSDFDDTVMGLNQYTLRWDYKSTKGIKKKNVMILLETKHQLLLKNLNKRAK